MYTLVWGLRQQFVRCRSTFRTVLHRYRCEEVALGMPCVALSATFYIKQMPLLKCSPLLHC
jgi:hypothetical protein